MFLLLFILFNLNCEEILRQKGIQREREIEKQIRDTCDTLKIVLYTVSLFYVMYCEYLLESKGERYGIKNRIRRCKNLRGD